MLRILTLIFLASIATSHNRLFAGRTQEERDQYTQNRKLFLQEQAFLKKWNFKSFYKLIKECETIDNGDIALIKELLKDIKVLNSLATSNSNHLGHKYLIIVVIHLASFKQ